MRAVILAVFLFCALGAKAQETFTVSFNDSDIGELIKLVSDVTGKTVAIDPRVKGKVTVVSKQPLTTDELYDLFLSVLDLHGFTAFESNGVVRVVPNKDVRSSPIPVVSNTPKADQSDEYVTEVIVLRNISAAKVLPVLRPLVAQHAHMAAYDPSNSIVISDTSSNIARIKKVIDKIDAAAVAQTEVVQLDYAPVEEAVKMIEQLLKGDKNTGSMKLVADARTNSILVSGDEIQRNRVRGLVSRIDRPQAQTGNVRVIYLEYADATEVSQVLNKLLQNMQKKADKAKQGTGASVEADEDTNALLITAEGDILDSLLQVVERLDIRRAQVLVEAIIAEIEDVDGTDLGVQWLFADQDGGFGGLSTGDGALGGAARAAFSDDDDAIEDLAGVVAGIAGATLGVGEFDGEEGFIALLNMLQRKTNSNILSTPSLLTTDNHEAVIAVGQEVPFVTGSFTSADGNSTNPFQTIERQNVGISLTVTPHINEGDKILLDIEQEVSSLTGETSASDVITNERSITTQVLAADGQVVVLGGLMRDNVQTFESKIPVLGSIPVLGQLFRSNRDSVTKTNLLVFIRATVIRNDETLTGTTAEKYRYIREQQLQRREKAGLLIDDDSLPVIPEWPVSPHQDLSGYNKTLNEMRIKRGEAPLIYEPTPAKQSAEDQSTNLESDDADQSDSQ
ncbi:type II secretion system secretin GspD [Marinibactrum halimedae]|uniref:Type II secretion system protein GspD n=1 Tax=Marinibactrum halimedae TaxID=1444977 RepID=A0AA37T5C0_9GAMM|nr:type II secretion system secretin GspD [Marinibactrum halimedae]MCD9458253.1 type II secretion system secretin GspD [Marinibactrum halimedae]GLS27120.1 type II secretion system protein GspD [Marinibactrum halimedae]